MGEASTEKAATEEALNAAQEKKTSTEKTVAADEAYLKELNQSCSAKAAEWAQRQKTAAEEVATIEKAKEILADGVKAFLQVRSATRKLSSRDSRRDDVVSVLRKLARDNRGYALSQLAVRAQSDTFGKVK